LPVIVPGWAGAEFTVTASVRAVLEPLALLAVTDMLPELDPKVTVMEVVPDPAVIEAPLGTLHVYPVAPVTELME